MPSDFPRSPKLLKGALVVYESQTPGPPPKVIVFQYNPKQLSRSLATRAAPREGSNVGAAREDVLRVLGTTPVGDTINLDGRAGRHCSIGEAAQWAWLGVLSRDGAKLSEFQRSE